MDYDLLNSLTKRRERLIEELEMIKEEIEKVENEIESVFEGSGSKSRAPQVSRPLAKAFKRSVSSSSTCGGSSRCGS